MIHSSSHVGDHEDRRFFPRLSCFLSSLKKSWRRDPPGLCPAALAYYAIIALAPTLLILIHLLSRFYGTSSARERILGALETYAGGTTTTVIKQVLEKAYASPSGVTATVLAIGVLLIAASRVFLVLQDALNHVWDLPTTRHAHWATNLRKRLLSFALVFGIGALLLASILLSGTLSMIERLFPEAVPTIFLFKVLNLLVFFLLTTLAWATLYRVVPDVDIRWSDVWLGALLASILLLLSRSAIGMYFAWSKLGSAYAAAGSLIVVLLWLYYVAQIALLGARVTRIYADQWGSHSRRHERPAGWDTENTHGPT